MIEKLTVKELRNLIKEYTNEMIVDFGFTTDTKRPLVFYRYKRRGDNLMQIELNELYSDEDQEAMQETFYCTTIGDMREMLSCLKDADEIIFSWTTEGKQLYLEDVDNIVRFNLQHK